jgi:hypothetical protein
MNDRKEPMTTKDAMKIVYFFTVIAAIPVGIWSYKFAENWLGAITWFVTIELALYFAAVFVLAVIGLVAIPLKWLCGFSSWKSHWFFWELS